MEEEEGMNGIEIRIGDLEMEMEMELGHRKRGVRSWK